MNHGSILVHFAGFVVVSRHSNYTFHKMHIAYSVRNILIFSKVLCYQAGFERPKLDLRIENIWKGIFSARLTVKQKVSTLLLVLYKPWCVV